MEIPTVTQTVKVDVTALLVFRKKLKEEGHAFSVNDFVLKAVAKALRRHPEILVSLDGEQIIRRAHVNLGMAVALDAGLIVPVIRDADLLSLEALSAKARDLAERAQCQPAGRRRVQGLHFHRVQSGHVRRGELHPHHQPAGRGHSGRQLHGRMSW